MSNVGRWIIVATMVIAAVLGVFTINNNWSLRVRPMDEGERFDGGFYTLVTDTGERLVMTTLLIGVDDQFIDADNNMFHVIAIEGDDAIVRLTGKADMPDVSHIIDRLAYGDVQPDMADLARAAVGGEGVDVGIYHTHNAESYEPTSGDAFEGGGDGDILEVGKALAENLEKEGLTVEWSDESHVPHDGQAYSRSRRTAAQILRQGPTTLFDIHRDAVPDKEQYTTEIDGETMSRVRLVVGKQNQNREANLEYAKTIKAIADDMYPGLIHGIFHARGNYNQDIGPRMMLLEVGTHQTPLEEAIRAMEPMAKVIALAVGATSGDESGRMSGSIGRSLLWLIVAAIGATVIWFIVNRDAWNEFKEKMSRLRS